MRRYWHQTIIIIIISCHIPLRVIPIPNNIIIISLPVPAVIPIQSVIDIIVPTAIIVAIIVVVVAAAATAVIEIITIRHRRLRRC